MSASISGKGRTQKMGRMGLIPNLDAPELDPPNLDGSEGAGSGDAALVGSDMRGA